MRDPLSFVPIRLKLPLTFLVVCLVVFGFGGVLVTSAARDALEGEIGRRLDVQSRAVAGAAERYLDSSYRRAEDFASDGFIRTEVERLIGEGARSDPERLRRHLNANKLSLVAAFVDAEVRDAAGELLVAARDGWPSARPSEPAEVQYGDLRPATDAHPYPTFVLTTPIRALDGSRVVGTLELLVRADVWIESLPELADLAPVELAAGAIVAPHGVRLPLGPGEASTSEARTYRHELGRHGWWVEFAVPASEIDVPIARLRDRYIVVGAVALALIAGVFFFPMRFMLRPLASIAETARGIARGDFGARVDFESRDEIGDLARAFNVMAAAVGERTRRLEEAADKLSRREKDVRFERDRLEAVIRSMHDAVFILDRDGEVTLTNEAAAPLVQSLAGQVPASKPVACTDPHDDSSCLACLGDFTHRHRSCVVAVGSRLFELYVIPFPGKREAVEGRLCVGRDVTERVAEAERQSHQERLSVLGEIAAVMAHELNNPLAAIAMFSQMLESKLAGDEALLESARVIRRNTESCKRTIRALLDMAVRATPDAMEFDVHDLLLDVQRLLRPLLDRRGAAFEIEPTDAVDRELVADELQVRQAIVNLVMNAVQGGATRVLAEIDGDEERVSITVADDGDGIPEAVRDEIFDPFFTTKPAGVGTGLGLPTARRMAEAHGGTLDLVRTGDDGTTFKLVLPRRAGGTPPRPLGALAVEGVIEDDGF